jgi:hypothetical protein
MKVLKYKCPTTLYKSILFNINNKQFVKDIFFLKEEGQYTYFDVVWNNDEYEELAEYKIWKPYAQTISHGYILDTEYIKSWCDTGVEHPLCGNINFRLQDSEMFKQKLIENGVEYYGH